MAGEILLSMERYTALLEAERMLGEVDKEYDKAEASGIPCPELRQIRAAYGQQIEALKANYSPTKMRRAEL